MIYVHIYSICVCINEIENLQNDTQKLLQLAIFWISGLGEKFVNHFIFFYTVGIFYLLYISHFYNFFIFLIFAVLVFEIINVHKFQDMFLFGTRKGFPFPLAVG